MEIQKNIAMSDKKRHGGGMPAKYPFTEMDKGDSFAVAMDNCSLISGSVAYWNVKLAPMEFKATMYEADGERVMADGEVGVRVFRIK